MRRADIKAAFCGLSGERPLRVGLDAGPWEPLIVVQATPLIIKRGRMLYGDPIYRGHVIKVKFVEIEYF